MGLMDRLREAEEQGKEAARNAYERARDLGEDVQRRLRQKMRIYPADRAATPSEESQAQPAATVPPESEMEDIRHLEAQRQPIISIEGKDVRPAPAPERRGNRKIA
jgi:hypothetical protein